MEPRGRCRRTTGVKTDSVTMASICCVVVRPLESLVLCQVMCRRRPRARVSGRRAKAGGDRKIPGFWDRVLSMEDAHGAVEAATLGNSVVFLRAEACFLGGFVEYVGHRVVAAIAASCTLAHRCSGAHCPNKSRVTPCTFSGRSAPMRAMASQRGPWPSTSPALAAQYRIV